MPTFAVALARPRPLFAAVLDERSPFRDPDDVRRFREGDRVVLEEVYRVYLRPVTSVVQSGLRASRRSRPIVDLVTMDLVQEVFLRAFAPAARRSFDGIRAYGPYIYTVARHVVIDWARRDGREIATDWSQVEALADEEIGDRFDGNEGDPYVHSIVSRYCESLEPALRAVLEVRYRRQLSQNEGARALGLSRQELRTLETRLRTGLRRALKRHALGVS
jgi:RNA polymerase sigma factor (sigma-70 family)